MLSFKKFSPRSFDWALAIAAALLVVFGLAAIYSVDLSRGQELAYFKRQLLAAAIGLALLAAASLTQYTFFRSYAKPAYVFSGLLLLAVLLVGANIRGTRGWFVLGGFSLQPVEIAKAGLIFMLAYIIYRFGRRFERPLFFVGTGLVAFLIMLMVIIQPDLGSAMILGIIWFGLMLLVGARRLYLAVLLGALAVVAGLAWFFFLHPYQKDRVLTFLHPNRDALGAGYNITQATIAIGSGQWLGRGLGFGSQSQLRFLPEAQTDFIFSVIGEELGFVGVAVLMILFSVVFWRLLVIVRQSSDDFAAAAVSGIAILFFSQFFINIGANIGLLPITGVTLPLVSYGGSSLIVSLFLIGVAESMVVKRY